jgi:hypothetical protein
MPNPHGPQFVNNPPRQPKLLVMFANGMVIRRVFSELPPASPSPEGDDGSEAGESRSHSQDTAEDVDAERHQHGG